MISTVTPRWPAGASAASRDTSSAAGTAVAATVTNNLVEECGFDLQAATDNASEHQIMALACMANSVSDSCVVSSNVVPFDAVTAVVQSLNDNWAVVDQGGTVLSPVCS